MRLDEIELGMLVKMSEEDDACLYDVTTVQEDSPMIGISYTTIRGVRVNEWWVDCRLLLPASAYPID